ncbi:MAG: hypothetical protein DWQ36_17275 [Acidobacteria bacterium]|nr:MAG: hypothetical protein DWQ30_05370 [Acidobacteriota bacterium]REK04598.1 MAG: hypothetical protein DWQ36_17275 [Acidobacteriota bacterium]
MHDTTELEELGLPAVFVASSEFREAALAQARSLGSPDRSVLVAHPIQDRTDDEVAALAETSVEQILARLIDEEAGKDAAPVVG